MLSDLRFAFRALCKTPGFTAAAILILALGIGANTSVFSVVDAVLLRPLPYAHPQELYTVQSAVGNQVGLFNLAEFCAYRDGNRSFAGLVATTAFNTTWVDRGNAQLVQGRRTSANLFELFGVHPLLGRLLRADDDRPGAAKVIAISEEFWRRAYGGDPTVVGRSVTVDGEPRTVVGVYPAGLLLPNNNYQSDVCVPLQPDANPARHQMAALHYLRVIGRLAPGVSASQAQADLDSVVTRLRQEYPNDFAGATHALVTPFADDIVGDTRVTLHVLLSIVGSLLLLAIANLAGLLLVRGLSRQRELAIRAALGCSRGRLMRLMLAESLLLAVAGGIVGTLFADWSVSALLSLVPADVPRAHDVQFNGRVLGFALGVSLLAGVLAGLAPVWLCSRMELRESVNTAGRGNTAGGSQMRARHVLASIQIALALALLACMGLFLRSFWAIQDQRPGVHPDRIVTARLTLPKADYPDVAALVRYTDALRLRVEAIPGVERSGTTSLLPLAQGLATTEFYVTGHPPKSDGDAPSGNYRLVTPGFFEAMGIPLISGRLFNPDDDERHPLAVIVSAELARVQFPDGHAVGQRLDINDAPNGNRTFEIVGVVGDIKQSKLEDAPTADLYVPFKQMTPNAVPWIRLRNYWVLRTAGPVQPIEDALRREVRAIDAAVPVAAIATLEQVTDSALAVRRFMLVIVAFLASAALLLTTAGVYATIAYGVTQRTREIGVRIALGATAQQIFQLIVKEGMILAASGAVLGVFVAFGLSQLITSQLYDVSPRDPATVGLAAVVLLAVALLACSLPARRAARVDPMEAMRTE